MEKEMIYEAFVECTGQYGLPKITRFYDKSYSEVLKAVMRQKAIYEELGYTNINGKIFQKELKPVKVMPLIPPHMRKSPYKAEGSTDAQIVKKSY